MTTRINHHRAAFLEEKFSSQSPLSQHSLRLPLERPLLESTCLPCRSIDEETKSKTLLRKKETGDETNTKRDVFIAMMTVEETRRRSPYQMRRKETKYYQPPISGEDEGWQKKPSQTIQVFLLR